MAAAGPNATLTLKPAGNSDVVNLSGGLPFRADSPIGVLEPVTISTVSGNKSVQRYRFTDSAIKSRLQALIEDAKSRGLNQGKFVFTSFTMNSAPMIWAQYAKYNLEADPTPVNQAENQIRVKASQVPSGVRSLFNSGNVLLGFSTVFQWNLAFIQNHRQTGSVVELDFDMVPAGTAGNEMMRIPRDYLADEQIANFYNQLAFLDEPNEFYFDDANLAVYFIPPGSSPVETSHFFLQPSGKSAQESHFTLALLDRLIVFGNEPGTPMPAASATTLVKYVTIDKLNFHDTRWVMTNGSSTAAVRHRFHSQSQGSPYNSGAIDGKYLDRVTIRNCGFFNLGGSGVRLGGSWFGYGHNMEGWATNVTVEKNVMAYLGGGGILVSSGKPTSGSILSNGESSGRDFGEVPLHLARTSVNVISENKIHMASSVFPDAAPILTMRTFNTHLLKNEVDWCNWACIHLGYGPAVFPESKNLVLENTLSRGMRVLADGTTLFITVPNNLVMGNRVGAVQRAAGAVKPPPQDVYHMTYGTFRGDAFGGYSIVKYNVFDSANIPSWTMKTGSNVGNHNGPTRYCRGDGITLEGVLCPKKKDEPPRDASQCKPSWWDEETAVHGPFDLHPAAPQCDP